jgi:hypothetical protein
VRRSRCWCWPPSRTPAPRSGTWSSSAPAWRRGTTLIGLPFLVSRARSERINRWLTIGSGILSLAFGIYLAYQIGIVDGLFTGDFHWEPA